jgi:hypothetical protein
MKNANDRLDCDEAWVSKDGLDPTDFMLEVEECGAWVFE